MALPQTYKVFSDPPFLLRDYLISALPAQLALLNAVRAASFVSGQVGPFTIPANAVMQIAAQGDATSNPINWHNIALTAGSRTSAQIVTDVTNASVPHLTVSVDSLGRVSFSSDTAPVSANPAIVSSLLLNTDTTFANIALGLPDGGLLTNNILPLVSPSLNEFYSYEHPIYKLGGNAPGGVPGVGSARYAIVDQRVKPNPKGVKSWEHDMTLRLEIADVAASATQILERMRMYARAVQECIAADRHWSTLGLQNEVVFSQVRDYHPQTKIFQFRGGGIGLPVGFEYMDVFARYIDPNTT